jgi:hypothetical protein
MTKRLCHHPNLHPTQWNEPKPEPCEVHGCECGQNWCCPVCDTGSATYPHECPPPSVLTVKDEYYEDKGLVNGLADKLREHINGARES